MWMLCWMLVLSNYCKSMSHVRPVWFAQVQSCSSCFSCLETVMCHGASMGLKRIGVHKVLSSTTVWASKSRGSRETLPPSLWPVALPDVGIDDAHIAHRERVLTLLFGPPFLGCVWPHLGGVRAHCCRSFPVAPSAFLNGWTCDNCFRPDMHAFAMVSVIWCFCSGPNVGRASRRSSLHLVYQQLDFARTVDCLSLVVRAPSNGAPGCSSTLPLAAKNPTRRAEFHRMFTFNAMQSRSCIPSTQDCSNELAGLLSSISWVQTPAKLWVFNGSLAVPWLAKSFQLHLVQNLAAARASWRNQSALARNLTLTAGRAWPSDGERIS